MKSRRFIATMLALVMMMVACSISMFALAVGEEDRPEGSVENLNIKSYMHFGDSMSTGYMLGATQSEIDAFNVAISDDFEMAFPKGRARRTGAL